MSGRNNVDLRCRWESLDYGSRVRQLRRGVAETAGPGLPLVVMGHSLGAGVVVAALAVPRARFAAAVLCGLPRSVAADPGALVAVRVPILAVHGVDDRIAPVGGPRGWVDRVPAARLREYANAGHDLLHEPVHRKVTDDVADFVVRTTVAG